MSAQIQPSMQSTPEIGPQQVELLTRLCNAMAVSGDEQEVRQIVLDEIRPYCDDIKVDGLGNILATHLGSQAQKVRVMIAAHMDEVGFMLTQDEGDGLFSLRLSAGWTPGRLWARQSSLGASTRRQ